MKGTIYPYPSECPHCGEKYFKNILPGTNEIIDIVCNKCNFRPDKFCIDARSLGLGRIFRDKYGDLIRNFNVARSMLLEMNAREMSHDLGRQLYFTKKRKFIPGGIKEDSWLTLKQIISLTGFKEDYIHKIIKDITNKPDVDNNMLVRYGDLRNYIVKNGVVILGDKNKYWFSQENDIEAKARYRVKLSKLLPSHKNVYSRISLPRKKCNTEKDIHEIIFDNYSRLFKLEGYNTHIYNKFDIGIYGIPDILSFHLDKEHNRVINVMEIKYGVVDNLGLMQLAIAMHGISKALSYSKNKYSIFGHMVGNAISKEGIKSILDMVGFNISFFSYNISDNIEYSLRNTMDFSLHTHSIEELSEIDNFDFIGQFITKWDEA